MVSITSTSDSGEGTASALGEKQKHLPNGTTSAPESPLVPAGNSNTKGAAATTQQRAVETIGRKKSSDSIEILDDEDEMEEVNEVILDDEDEDNDDDDVRVIEEPMPKRARKGSGQGERGAVVLRQAQSPVPEDPKTSKESIPTCEPTTIVLSTSEVAKKKEEMKEEAAAPASTPLLTTYSALLGRLDEYVKSAIDKGENVERKVLDALLAAINIQVQKEPYSVRKLILDKHLVLPNTISFPPSQVVEMMIEHDPDHQLPRVINRLFGEERPKLSDNERRERQMLKTMYPAPSMTKLLLEIGQDLVQECTYHDIVHARNLPEMPKNMDTYKQVAAQLKPVWEALKAKNSAHKLKTFSCQACGFKTDSRTMLAAHRQTLHYVGRRYQCTYCPEFDTNDYRLIKHIMEEHGVKPIAPEPAQMGVGCPICDEEFHYKVQRDQHLKMCRRDLSKLRTVQLGRAPVDVNMINRWLWDKPPTEPSILNQEAQQRQQQLRQQQILLQQQQLQQQQMSAAAAFAKAAAATNAKAAALRQQQQQEQLRQQQRMMARQKQIANNPTGSNLFAGAAAGTLSARLGLAILGGPANQQQQAKNLLSQQQRANLVALAGGSKQPSVGEILRMAKVGQTNLTPQMIQAAIQAQALQMRKSQQIQQKSQQILAAASASNLNLPKAPISVGGIVGQQQRVQQGLGGASGATGSGDSRKNPIRMNPPTVLPPPLLERQAQLCEICDFQTPDKDGLRLHIQAVHRQLLSKTAADMAQGAPLACSRCRERFWTYEGLERHLAMAHGLVTADLLAKAQNKRDAGKCKLCGKQYAFNILQHLVGDHSVKLCSAEIMYSCDVCSFKCSSYQKLERHLSEKHPKT